MFVEITTRVIPAHLDGLEKFPVKDLRGYAKCLGLDVTGMSKDEICEALVASGKATVCASLGN